MDEFLSIVTCNLLFTQLVFHMSFAKAVNCDPKTNKILRVSNLDLISRL